ncbi:MAG: DUF423 domain-containing protein [Myxococcota bacterium]|jgi:uncharacterized membrane protein YgdD (TMEM256/DUF423 family)|nr:DUF423 domain-containing protein [Myxococcota bacterium]
MTQRNWLQIVGLLGAVAVAAGAFGTHGLKDRVSPERLVVWATASRYLMWHTLALFAVVLSQDNLHSWRWSLRCWLAGCLVFSGSLFALVLLDQSWLGALTPAGGILLLSGWVLVFRQAVLNEDKGGLA